MIRWSPRWTPLLLILIVAPCAGAGEPWRELRTAHYTIKTDLPPALVDELAKRMDAMYVEYSTRLQHFAPPDADHVLEVRLYARKDDYMTLTSNMLVNTGGVFMPSRNLLAAYLEDQGRDALRRTLQHEAFHQFAHAAISRDLPVWLNEGMAQYFEEGIWTGRSFVVGQVPPRRLRQLQADMKLGRLTPFRDFMSISHEEWARNRARDQEIGATLYNQAWAMVHFLVHGENDGRPYRPRLIEMLQLLHDGVPAEDAFREAFSDNIEGFQARFVEWARSLDATSEATLIERQGTLADLLIVLDGEGRRFSNIAEFRDALVEGGYRLQYRRNHLQWESEADPRIYFAHLTGQVYTRDQLYFAPRSGAPLPDIVCRFSAGYQLRTRFHEASGEIEHEATIEPVH